MALERLHFETREDWLAGRSAQGIGASEAGAVCGLSPFMTPLTLWRLKLGVDEPQDLSQNAAVRQGVRMEPVIRDFFAALHPEYTVEHYPYDMLFQAERPWLFATLDGELSSGAERGILEIKTATPSGRAGWANWADGRVPAHYATQCMHQLLATGWDFVILFAALWSMNGDITLREYEFRREDHEADLAWLLEKEEEFMRYVRTRTPPPAPLML